MLPLSKMDTDVVLEERRRRRSRADLVEGELLTILLHRSEIDDVVCSTRNLVMGRLPSKEKRITIARTPSSLSSIHHDSHPSLAGTSILVPFIAIAFVAMYQILTRRMIVQYILLCPYSLSP